MKRALLDYDSDDSSEELPKAQDESLSVAAEPPVVKKRHVATELWTYGLRLTFELPDRRKLPRLDSRIDVHGNCHVLDLMGRRTDRFL